MSMCKRYVPVSHAPDYGLLFQSPTNTTLIKETTIYFPRKRQISLFERFEGLQNYSYRMPKGALQ